MTASILSLRDTSPPAESGETPDLWNVPRLLRRIADQLEAGELCKKEFLPGVHGALVLSLPGEAPGIFGLGAEGHLAQSFADFHLGAAEILRMMQQEN